MGNPAGDLLTSPDWKIDRPDRPLSAPFQDRNSSGGTMCRDKKDFQRNPSGMALLLTVLVSAPIACNGSSGPLQGLAGVQTPAARRVPVARRAPAA